MYFPDFEDKEKVSLFAPKCKQTEFRSKNGRKSLKCSSEKNVK